MTPSLSTRLDIEKEHCTHIKRDEEERIKNLSNHFFFIPNEVCMLCMFLLIYVLYVCVCVNDKHLEILFLLINRYKNNNNYIRNHERLVWT